MRGVHHLSALREVCIDRFKQVHPRWRMQAQPWLVKQENDILVGLEFVTSLAGSTPAMLFIAALRNSWNLTLEHGVEDRIDLRWTNEQGHDVCGGSALNHFLSTRRRDW